MTSKFCLHAREEALWHLHNDKVEVAQGVLYKLTCERKRYLTYLRIHFHLNLIQERQLEQTIFLNLLLFSSYRGLSCNKACDEDDTASG